MRLSYILLGAAILGILIFAVIHLVRNVRASIPSILGVIGIALVYFIMYGTTAEAAAQGDFTPGMIQAASAGIMSTYVLGVVAIIGIIVGEIWSSFR